MKPKVSEADIDRMVAQAGLPLSADQKRVLYDAYWMLEGMIARVNQPLPREAEPAHLFIVEDVR
ncbi:MAG: hypothetical protein ACHQAY_18360 [Hyphomicrobiales bacterium]